MNASRRMPALATNRWPYVVPPLGGPRAPDRLKPELRTPACLFLIACLAALVDARAFVLDHSTPVAPRHWDLVTPESHASPGAFIYVSTNAVNPVTKAVRFFIAEDAYSTTNTAAELNAVRASFAQWQVVPNTILKFEDAGLLPKGVDVNEDDGTNVIYWTKTTTLVAGGTADISSALGVTFYSALDDVLVGSDVVLNGTASRGYRWFTDPTTVTTDTRAQFIEAVLAHELGHFLGLEHAPLGGGTLYYLGAAGMGPSAGLAADDMAGVQYLYATPGALTLKGRIQGKVTLNGGGILGAVVVAEERNGRGAYATLSLQDGAYDLPALPPGDYGVRVTPLDSTATSQYLMRGRDVSPYYAAAQTGFLPATNALMTVRANTTETLNFAVTGGVRPFWVSALRKPTTNPASQVSINTAIALRVGQTDMILGVYGPNLPATNSVLEISGDGLTVTPIDSASLFTQLNLVSVKVSVSSNATPGVRSFTLKQGNNLAYANGFLDIQPAFPDWNLDGLDDLFQRRYFPLFTAPQASPGADPDSDGFSNRYEYLAESVPTNSASLPRVEISQISVGPQGSTISWRGVPSARYQLHTRDSFAGSEPWRPIGSMVTATNSSPRFLDPAPGSVRRFYRVEAIPGQP